MTQDLLTCLMNMLRVMMCTVFMYIIKTIDCDKSLFEINVC